MRLLAPPRNRVQIADAAIGEDHEIATTMDIAHFDKPRLARPLMASRGLVVEWGRNVVDARLRSLPLAFCALNHRL